MLEKLLDFSPDATIGDRSEQPGKGGILGCFGIQTLRIRFKALAVECEDILQQSPVELLVRLTHVGYCDRRGAPRPPAWTGRA